jgi:hypothetical protein
MSESYIDSAFRGDLRVARAPEVEFGATADTCDLP